MEKEIFSKFISYLRAKYFLAVCGFILGFVMVSADLDVDNYAVTGDEISYFLSSVEMLDWLAIDDREDRFARDTILKHFYVLPEKVVHPNLSRWLMAFSYSIFYKYFGLSEIYSVRLYQAFVYGLIIAITIAYCMHLYGVRAGFLALVLVAGNIRLFGHAHTAQTDLLLTLLWLIATLSAYQYVVGRKWGLFWVLTVACGLLIATKLTGVLLFGAIFFYILLFGGRSKIYRAMLFLVSVSLIFFLLHPQIWHGPIDWAIDFYRSFVGREESIVIPTIFLGQLYGHRVPWYVPFVHVIVTTPIPILFGCILAMISGMRLLIIEGFGKNDRWCWIILTAMLPLVASSFPSVPSHDLERLTLPMQPLMVILSVAGYVHTVHLVASGVVFPGLLRNISGKKHGIIWIFVFTLCATVIPQAVIQHPYHLTYFNALVGGERGAYRLGFDVAYYSLELNDEVLGAINRILPEGSSLYSTHMYVNLNIAKNVGRLRKDISVLNSETDADYVLIYARRSNMTRKEEKLYLTRPDPIWSLTINGADIFLLYRMSRRQG